MLFGYECALEGKEIDKNEVSRVIPEGNWWTWESFPLDSSHPFLNKNKEYNIKPSELAEALGEFASTTKSIATILEERGLKNSTFNTIRKRFPMVDISYKEAQKAKAEMLGSEAVDIFQKKIPEEFWTIDKFNNKVLTMSGVRFLEAKSAALFRSAAAHEAGSYQNRAQVESKNLMLNVNANLELKDILSMDVESLMKPED